MLLLPWLTLGVLRGVGSMWGAQEGVGWPLIVTDNGAQGAVAKVGNKC